MMIVVTPKNTPQELLERALDLREADDCLVIAEELSLTNLRWANNTVISNGNARNRLLTVVAIVEGSAGKAVGVVSRNGVTHETLPNLLDAAVHKARRGIPAEDAQPLVQPYGQSSNWDLPPLDTSFAVFNSFIPALGEAMSSARASHSSLCGYAAHCIRSIFVASSTGLRVRFDEPSGYVQLTMRSVTHPDSVWAGTNTTDFSAQLVGTLYQQLMERFTWSKQRRLVLPPGRYETVLAPSAVADLMVCTYDSLGARAALDGRSVFSKSRSATRLGDRLSTATVTLRSDPSALGLNCIPFVLTASPDYEASVFDTGVRLEPTQWIREGILSSLVQTRHSAGLIGVPVTPRIDNLIMEDPRGGSTKSDMIRRTARGLLVSCVWYVRELNPQTLLVTGLTRDGTFLVEHGEVVGAINNFRFNESPVALLNRIVEIGACEPTLARERGPGFPRTTMPYLRIEDFNMSSVSEAW